MAPRPHPRHSPAPARCNLSPRHRRRQQDPHRHRSARRLARPPRLHERMGSLEGEARATGALQAARLQGCRLLRRESSQPHPAGLGGRHHDNRLLRAGPAQSGHLLHPHRPQLRRQARGGTGQPPTAHRAAGPLRRDDWTRPRTVERAPRPRRSTQTRSRRANANRGVGRTPEDAAQQC